MATTDPVSISAAPVTGQLVKHNGVVYETVREGRAYILVPPNTRSSVDPRVPSKAVDGSEIPQNVFYNPIQQFNRDLSVLAIKAYGEDACEKKRLKYEREHSKITARKERKRKRRTKEEDEAEGDSSVKVHKTHNGVAAPAVDELAANGQEEQQVEEHIPEQSGPPDSNVDDSITVRQEQLSPDHEPPHRVSANGDVEATHVTTIAQTSEEQPWKPRFRILDALSATGLRALRYATEIPFATSVTANDMDRKAVNSIKVNVEHNRLSSVVTPTAGNAMALMYGAAFPPADSHGANHVSGKFDVIDLDPYGTAAPFIDSALQALNDGGLLCVTCTDSGVFASCGYSEKTYSLYGGIPVKGPHSHEGGLRVILNSIASAAAKYGLAIEPLLSLSIDFYCRMFIRVRKSPADVKFLAGKVMLVYGCDSGCGSWTTQMLGRNLKQAGKHDTIWWKHSIAQAPSADRLCEHCGSKTHVAGPMWAGPIHNAAFVDRILDDLGNVDGTVYQTKPRLEGMLTTALDELVVIPAAPEVWPKGPPDAGSRAGLAPTPPELVDLHPFFFIPSALAKVLHCQAPSEAAFKGALRHAGYRATRSHCKPGSTKTDAPWAAIWAIMREWVRQRAPIKAGALTEGQPGWRILHAAPPPHPPPPGAASDLGPDGPAPRPPPTTPAGPAASFPVVFDEALGRDPPGRKLVRYQQNPRENWGPMARAKGGG